VDESWVGVCWTGGEGLSGLEGGCEEVEEDDCDGEDEGEDDDDDDSGGVVV